MERLILNLAIIYISFETTVNPSIAKQVLYFGLDISKMKKQTLHITKII